MGSCNKLDRTITKKAFVAWIIGWAFIVARIHRAQRYGRQSGL